MDATITPAKAPGADVEQLSEEDWRDDGPDDRGEGDALRSVVLILAGSVAIGIAVAAVIGVRLSHRRKSKSLLGRAVTRAEDTRDTLAQAAAGLPERGKAAARRVRR